MIPLSFTYPATEPVTEQSCAQGGQPERRLAELRLYLGDSQTPYRVKLIGGREGQQDTLQVDPGTWCIALRDSAGNEAAPPCRVCRTVSAPVSVGVPPGVDPEPRYYDLAGRRVRPPLRSGLYFVRVNGTRRTILVR